MMTYTDMFMEELEAGKIMNIHNYPARVADLSQRELLSLFYSWPDTKGCLSR